MSLPDFNAAGELPAGVHCAALDEVLLRFGSRSGQRGVCTRHLSHVYELARCTRHLQRFIIFGSFITAQSEPNDVDVVLVMDDDFCLEECPMEARGLFDHTVAQVRYGTSIFWMRPGMLIGENIQDFVAYWQIKRDGSRRGIVEVIP